MSTATLDGIYKVAAVDDNLADAKAFARRYQGQGRVATPFTDLDRFSSADDFLDMLDAEHFDALVCDLVLKAKKRVSFNGAELVSKANRRAGRKIPAVLISSYVGTDKRWLIQLHREGIPVALDKAKLRSQGLDALATAVAEVREGKTPRERRAFPTPIEVIATSPSGQAPTATVVVVGWDIEREIKTPLTPILQALDLNAGQTLPRWLQAEVNCYAKSEDELYFRKFAPAPELPEGWMVA